MTSPTDIAFGPIPSRRLGRSLGVNHLPAKHCTYSCVYCQVGETAHMEIARRAFYPTEEVVAAVTGKVVELRAAGEGIDYISFVPDGEPTLDRNLGAMIHALKPMGIPIAVITSGALLSLPDVRADLAEADLVSVKVDATIERVWRRINRPNGRIDFDAMLRGIAEFAREYPGELVTDTMLVAGLNDDPASLEGVAAFLATLAPRRAYLGVPTRPPADPRVRPPGQASIDRAAEILRATVPHLTVLETKEEGRFGHAGDPAQALLAILAVHPMQEAAVRKFLSESGAGWDLVEAMVREGRLSRIEYRGQPFYLSEESRSG